MGRKAKSVDPAVDAARQKLADDISAFCQLALNKECEKLCLKLLDTWSKHDPQALLRGKPAVSAAAVIHTIASINALFYADSKPRASGESIARYFGVSTGGVSTRVSALKWTMQESGVPIERFLTQRTKSYGTRQQELLSQVMQLFQGGEGPFADSEGPMLDEDGCFYDADRPVMSDYYDLMQRFPQGDEDPALIAALRQLIARDPDFYDTYNSLAELVDDEEGRALTHEAYIRAVARLAPDGTWPERIEWGYLENRHVLRALLNEAIDVWDEGNMAEAIAQFKQLLHICPNDNMGVRYYLLACREGKTFAQHEEQFISPRGFYDGKKLMEWFDHASPQYEADFAAWRKQMEQYE